MQHILFNFCIDLLTGFLINVLEVIRSEDCNCNGADEHIVVYTGKYVHYNSACT